MSMTLCYYPKLNGMLSDISTPTTIISYNGHQKVEHLVHKNNIL